MGGNRYTFRKSYTDDELDNIISFNIQNPLISFFNKKVFDNLYSWRMHMSYYLDQESSRRFFYKMEIAKNGDCKCLGCETILGISYFNNTYTSPRYCNDCKKNYVWAKKENIDPVALATRQERSSVSLRKHYQTEKGKEQAKRVGMKNSIAMKRFNKTEQGKRNIEKSKIYNSITMLNKIENGEFTPNSNNKNTHWNSSYKGNKYRSSWEALYHHLYPNSEYEVLRIPYYINGKRRIYIVDFIDHNTKIVAEVKPRSQTTASNFIIKWNSLLAWCKENDYTPILADEYFLTAHQMPIDVDFDIMFDPSTTRKIRKLYETTKN